MIRDQSSDTAIPVTVVITAVATTAPRVMPPAVRATAPAAVLAVDGDDAAVVDVGGADDVDVGFVGEGADPALTGVGEAGCGAWGAECVGLARTAPKPS